MSVLNRFLNNVLAQIVNPIILLLSAVAFVVFVWGLFEFVRNAGDATKRKTGREAIMWGLIGLVIMFGAYGLINIALSSFNLGTVQGALQGNLSK